MIACNSGGTGIGLTGLTFVPPVLVRDQPDEGLGGGARDAQHLAGTLPKAALVQTPQKHAPVNLYMLDRRRPSQDMRPLQMGERGCRVAWCVGVGCGLQLGVHVKTNAGAELAHDAPPDSERLDGLPAHGAADLADAIERESEIPVRVAQGRGMRKYLPPKLEHARPVKFSAP